MAWGLRSSIYSVGEHATSAMTVSLPTRIAKLDVARIIAWTTVASPCRIFFAVAAPERRHCRGYLVARCRGVLV